MPDYRAHLDASITFINGGSLTVDGFRLDLPSADLDESAIGRLLVQHLGVTLVGSVDAEEGSEGRVDVIEGLLDSGRAVRVSGAGPGR